MKTLVIYYSYSGKTRKIANEIAMKEDADVVEIKDVKRIGKFRAYTSGCLAAMTSKAWPIQPIETDYAKYERLVLLAPVWAGNPPPAFHSFMEQLPADKIISVKMISASGKISCRAKLEKVIKAKNGSLTNFEDIKV